MLIIYILIPYCRRHATIDVNNVKDKDKDKDGMPGFKAQLTASPKKLGDVHGCLSQPGLCVSYSI